MWVLWLSGTALVVSLLALAVLSVVACLVSVRGPTLER